MIKSHDKETMKSLQNLLTCGNEFVYSVCMKLNIINWE